MRLYQAPQIFPETMAREEWSTLIRSAASQADETFQTEYFKLDNWFRRYDALYLLTYCSVYFLAHPEGTDPEAKGGLDFYPFYLEILQAFSLMQERSFESNLLGGEASDLLDSMGTIGDALTVRTMRELVDVPEQDIYERHVLLNMRRQTTAVRNWSYPQHMRKVTQDLARTVSQDFFNLYKIDSVAFVNVLFRLAETAEDRLNQHMNRVRDFYRQRTYQRVVSSYNKSFPDIKDFDADHVFDIVGQNLKNLKAMLIHYSDLRLSDNLTFTVDDIVDAYGEGADRRALKRLFDYLSIGFGDLSEQNREYVILDNPVWKKPFIKIGSGVYFSAVIGLLPHYALQLFEVLASTNSSMEEKYRQRKSKYLEDELEKLFRRSFSNGVVHRGSLWKDDAGNVGENDLTLVLGCMAVIVEAKSGVISPSASRGAPGRFKRTVKELIDEPAEQANNFIQILQSLQTPHDFLTKNGSVNTIDVCNVRYFVPLTVTLEQFGSVSNLRELVEAGISAKKLSELAPVISLTDLMVIFEILDLQCERVHYLARRREFGTHVHFYGDELDVLAFYLDHGLNVGEMEYTGEHSILLTMGSKQLDPYFLGQDAGLSIVKPQLALTEWWRSIIEHLEIRQREHWLDIAILLLNIPYIDQQKFERRFEKLSRKVRRGKLRMPHNWAVLLAGPAERQFFIALYPYMAMQHENRNSVVSEILDQKEAENARGAICIGVNLDHNELPYSVIALRKLPDLFDQL